MPQSLSLVIVQIISRGIPGIVETIWGAVRRTLLMGLIYGAGLQLLMIFVNLPPGARPPAGMKRAFGASLLWKMIDRPLPKRTNSTARSNRPDLLYRTCLGIGKLWLENE